MSVLKTSPSRKDSSPVKAGRTALSLFSTFGTGNNGAGGGPIAHSKVIQT